ncbi:MAG: LysR family transcriptional regulator [Sulfitobacter sp.]
MKPTLKQIDAFVQVADLGSFRRAAARLNTTQPNISAHIAALETLLDTSLMTRDAGSVRLTPKGETLLPHARAVLRAVEGLVTATGNPALTEGVLRLGVTELIVHTWLPDFLRALREAAPNVLVELTVDVSTSLSAGLFGRMLDLTFQNGPFQRRSTGLVALGEYPLIWAASPALNIDTRTPLRLTDLTKFPVLTHARGTLPYDQLAAHVSASGVAAPRLVPSSNLSACLQMTLDGFGIACLPRVMVESAVSAGALVELPYDWRPDPLRFAARFEVESAPSFLLTAVQIAASIDHKK